MNQQKKDDINDLLSLAVIAACVAPIVALGLGAAVRVFEWAAF